MEQHIYDASLQQKITQAVTNYYIFASSAEQSD